MVLPSRSASLIFSAILYIRIASALVEESATANPDIYQYICRPGFDLVKGQCRGLVEQDDNVQILDALALTINKCSEINALPPIIRNSEDHDYWVPIMPGKHVVIGIVCDARSMKWKWIDGSAIDYRPANHEGNLDGWCDFNGVWYYSNYDATKWFYTAPTMRGATFNPLSIYCFADLKKPEIHDDDCIKFDHDESDSMCYQVSQEAEYWSDARDKCKSTGSDLASIHSAQENSFIRRLAVSKGIVTGLQLGATVSGKSDSFGWLDGSDMNYTNFFPGFPVSGLGDCLVMATGDTNGEWLNTACTTKLPYVCARKPYSPPKTCPGDNIKEGETVLTPGFPLDASTPCDFYLQVDDGKLVEIEVLLLEANNCCDHLVLFDGTSEHYRIANMTGTTSGAKFRTQYFNQMKVSWQTNGGVNVRGAMFTFRGV